MERVSPFELADGSSRASRLLFTRRPEFFTEDNTVEIADPDAVATIGPATPRVYEMASTPAEATEPIAMVGFRTLRDVRRPSGA